MRKSFKFIARAQETDARNIGFLLHPDIQNARYISICLLCRGAGIVLTVTRCNFRTTCSITPSAAGQGSPVAIKDCNMVPPFDSRRKKHWFLASPRHAKREVYQCLFTLSGCRESNPGRAVPNREHYHYATPRNYLSETRLPLFTFFANINYANQTKHHLQY